MKYINLAELNNMMMDLQTFADGCSCDCNHCGCDCNHCSCDCNHCGCVGVCTCDVDCKCQEVCVCNSQRNF